jgi:hypothetical protein
MISPLKYFFLMLICLVIFVAGKAQDLDSLPSVIIQDSVYETPANQNENYQFKELTAQGEIGTRKVSDNNLNKLKSDEDYWYVNQKPPRDRETSSPSTNQKGEKEKKSRGLFNIPWLNVLFWIILIGGFIALLVWFLKTSDIRLFRKKSKPVEEQVEETTEDIFEMNFEKEIQKTIDAKDFRLAVRLMYLRTLRDLSNRNLISYTHEKTNADYLLQLANTPYYKNFFRLTRNFDYTWYGQFELLPDSFTVVQNDFSSFKQQLS